MFYVLFAFIALRTERPWGVLCILTSLTLGDMEAVLLVHTSFIARDREAIVSVPTS